MNLYERHVMGRSNRAHYSCSMQLALWLSSAFLAAAMIAAGGMKLAVPRARLAERMTWARTWKDGTVKLLGAAEVLGGLGLIIPQATGVVPMLTPIAATCLLVLMLGAVKTHADLAEPVIAPAILAALALFVALGRFGVLS